MIEALDRRLEALEQLGLAARRDGRHGAAVEGIVAGDDAIALGLADLVEILAHDLDAAFHRLGARVGEEHRVGEGRIDQPLGQTLLTGDAEHVRGVPQLLALTDQRIDQMGMGVAERGHRDSRGEIEIALALRGEQIGALAPLEREIDPGIDRQDRWNHERLPNAAQGGA